MNGLYALAKAEDLPMLHGKLVSTGCRIDSSRQSQYQFDKAYELFMTYCRAERNYASETQSKIQDCFSRWLLPAFGGHDVAQITKLNILELRRRMMDSGIGISRQYGVLMSLKLFLRFCRATLEISCLNPAEIKLPRRPSSLVEFLTEEEVQTVLKSIDVKTIWGLRLRVLIEVLLSTGMRISEVLSLNRDTIDFEQGEAEIVGKGSKRRTVFFNPRCLQWIRQYLATRQDTCPAMFVTLRSQPKRWTRRDMSHLFKRLKDNSGIQKHLTPHLFRHTFCTHLLHNGADITFIKELAGHQDIETTAKYYLGINKKALKEVLQRCQKYAYGNANVAPGIHANCAA